MQTKHTPGPWSVQTGSVIAGFRPDDSGLPLMVAQLVVPIHYSGELGRQADVNVMHENARLIAAAPDLLEACTQAIGRLKTLYDADEATNKDIEVLSTLMQAVAKVTSTV